MSYDCSDFVQDITNEADRLGLLTEAELTAMNAEDNPRASADAVLRVLNLIPRLRAIVQEFKEDVEAAGAVEVGKDWPDLLVTYNKARRIKTKGKA